MTKFEKWKQSLCLESLSQEMCASKSLCDFCPISKEIKCDRACYYILKEWGESEAE